MASALTDISALIVRSEGVQGGMPCLAGTRYPVLEVAVHYSAGATPEEIAAEYTLPLPQVYAAVAFYLANRAAMDAELANEQREYSAALQQVAIRSGSAGT